jgi:hypothetical protein
MATLTFLVGFIFTGSLAKLFGFSNIEYSVKAFCSADISRLGGVGKMQALLQQPLAIQIQYYLLVKLYTSAMVHLGSFVKDLLSV